MLHNGFVSLDIGIDESSVSAETAEYGSCGWFENAIRSRSMVTVAGSAQRVGYQLVVWFEWRSSNKCLDSSMPSTQ